jgi:GNAT superfamily N-acetyltransferase
MIRRCDANDFEIVWAIINDGARSYKGTIPEDCYEEPYMSQKHLQHEIDEGVAFWGYEESGILLGVMGSQQVQDVTLIRHAYVRTGSQRRGIGALLLSHLRQMTKDPVLIGTWADAAWAIQFYECHGFRIVSREEKDRLLKQYWTVPRSLRATFASLPRATDRDGSARVPRPDPILDDGRYRDEAARFSTLL